jgi:hypothetical protein
MEDGFGSIAAPKAPEPDAEAALETEE